MDTSYRDSQRTTAKEKTLFSSHNKGKERSFDSQNYCIRKFLFCPFFLSINSKLMPELDAMGCKKENKERVDKRKNKILLVDENGEQTPGSGNVFSGVHMMGYAC